MANLGKICRCIVLLLVGVCLLSACGSEVKRTQATTKSKPKSATVAQYGIDVSHHNGVIDWKKVSKTPLLFVYVKATEGATHVDKRYAANIAGARKAGYKVGSYHFFRMTSGAHAQFANFAKTVDRRKQDLIPMVDVETADKHPVSELRDSLNVFIGLIRKHYGVRPMIYATNRSYNELCGGLYPSYPLYIGRYGSNPPQLKGKSRYTIWQYTESAHIDGIPKPVDQAHFAPTASLTDILLPSK